MYIDIERTTRLDGPILPESLPGLLFMNENQAHRFTIRATKAGEDVALSGSVTGRFLRSDGQTILLTGTVSEGAAVVILPQDCYDVQGRFIMALFNVASGSTTTIYAATGNVSRTQSGSIIDPGNVVPDIDDLLAEIENMREATAAAVAAAEGALANFAPAFVEATANAAGTYVTYTDGKMYYLPTGHTANATWANTTKQAVTSGGELADLKSAIDPLQVLAHHLGNMSYQLTKPGGYVRKTTYGSYQPGDILPTNNGAHTDFILVTGANSVSAYTTGNSGVAVIAFYDADKEYISGVAGTDSASAMTNYSETVPQDAKYVVFSAYSSTVNYKASFTCSVNADGGGLLNSALSIKGKVQANTDLNDITNAGIYMFYAGYTYQNTPPNYTSGGFWLIVFNVGDTQMAQIFVRSSSDQFMCARIGNYVSGTFSWKNWVNYYNNVDMIDKKVSIVGDSISTFENYIPSGWNNYYPRGNVTSVDATWWMIAIRKLGAVLLKNASYAASSVAGDSSDGAAVAFSDERINALADGTTTPDIVICYIGTNDFARNYDIGTWSDKQEVPSGAVITDFKPAYARMIDKIQTSYPLAKIYCCTLIARTKGTDYTIPVLNNNGDSIYDFNEAIRDVARQLNCSVIDLSSCGINQHNLADMLINEDGSYIHPKAAGHLAISDRVYKSILC